MRKYFAVILSVPKNFAIKLSSYMIQKMRQIAFSQIEHLSNEFLISLMSFGTWYSIQILHFVLVRVSRITFFLLQIVEDLHNIYFFKYGQKVYPLAKKGHKKDIKSNKTMKMALICPHTFVLPTLCI